MEALFAYVDYEEEKQKVEELEQNSNEIQPQIQDNIQSQTIIQTEIQDQTLNQNEESQIQSPIKTQTKSYLSACPSFEELTQNFPKLIQENVDPHLKSKVEKFFQLKQEGKTINLNLAKSRSFHNPDILEKLITFCKIDEIQSNYPPELYNPLGGDPADFYDELAKEQSKELEARMQAQQNRTQIEFVKGKTPPANPTLDHKRKFEYAQSVINSKKARNNDFVKK